ncbi:MAG TPA: flagellar hook capping FlgD N-terminal domain-containing protein [Planctomycetota bacterium]|nr:flagellar hook capping FlgD N-terminal domain-containing protein [Planctomycetota bacterium]
MTSSIPPTTGNNGSSILSPGGGSFGQNPFLQLLTEQLKSQTPLEPVDNASFMNQMAQYSSMQQQQDLNTNLMRLLNFQGLLARVQGLSDGSALLGKQVTYDTDQAHGLTGTVQSVFMNDQGEIRARLTDGTDIGMSQINSISSPPSSS